MIVFVCYCNVCATCGTVHLCVYFYINMHMLGMLFAPLKRVSGRLLVVVTRCVYVCMYVYTSYIYTLAHVQNAETAYI